MENARRVRCGRRYHRAWRRASPAGVRNEGWRMDRLSAIMLRAGFVWLLAGAIVGFAMMIDEVLPGAWRAWMAPTHGHMLFVGWFVQFALGIAYWLLPRKRTPDRPLGYDERWGLVAVAMLNAGLLLRVVAEPAQ